MTDRTRVHEIARELGVPVKDVLARLNGQGVMARSGSSTVTGPGVERWLRDSYGLRGEAKPKPNPQPLLRSRRMPLWRHRNSKKDAGNQESSPP